VQQIFNEPILILESAFLFAKTDCFVATTPRNDKEDWEILWEGQYEKIEPDLKGRG